MRRILVTGAIGHIGSELVPALRARYGDADVVASDVRMPAGPTGADGPFEYVDCQHLRQIESVIRRYDIDTIYHMAAVLSAGCVGASQRKSVPLRPALRGVVGRVLVAGELSGFAPQATFTTGDDSP